MQIAEPAKPPEAGSKSSKYREFVRKFAADLHANASPATGGNPAVPQAWEADDSTPTEGIVILDMEVDLSPPSRAPQSNPEEIVFID